MVNSVERKRIKGNTRHTTSALLRDVKEAEALITHLHRDKIASLKYSLASRLHLEKLVETYWERKVKEENNENEDQSEGVEGLKQLRLRILQHPYLSKSPLIHRWPVQVNSLSQQSEWSLGDEVMATLLREKKKKRPQNLQTSNDDNEENLESHVPSDHPLDIVEDEIPLNLVLPIIAHCQGSLNKLFYSIANRIAIGGKSGQKRLNRKDIITWRDVLKSIKLMSNIPKTVVQSTEQRLFSITGSAQSVPSAALMANLGGKRCSITQTLKNNTFVSRSEDQSDTRSAEQRHLAKRKRLQDSLNDMDDEVFSLSNVQYTTNFLQPYPIKIRHSS